MRNILSYSYHGRTCVKQTKPEYVLLFWFECNGRHLFVDLTSQSIGPVYVYCLHETLIYYLYSTHPNVSTYKTQLGSTYPGNISSDKQFVKRLIKLLSKCQHVAYQIHFSSHCDDSEFDRLRNMSACDVHISSGYKTQKVFAPVVSSVKQFNVHAAAMILSVLRFICVRQRNGTHFAYFRDEKCTYNCFIYIYNCFKGTQLFAQQTYFIHL